jgi:hypothetical protein
MAHSKFLNRVFAFISTMLFLGMIAGCGEQHSLVVVAPDWPDGSGITVLTDDGRAVDGSRLYGGRTRIFLPGTGPISLSIAHHRYLTEHIVLSEGTSGNPVSLSPPVPRRTEGAGSPGIIISDSLPDSLYDAVCRDSQAAVAAVSPLLEDARAARIVPIAHASGIVVLPRVHVTDSDSHTASDIADQAVRAGVEGVILDPEPVCTGTDWFARLVLDAAGLLHQRGMTLAVRIPVPCAFDRVEIPESLAALFSELPEPERPDELILAFTCDGIPTAASVDRIAEVLGVAADLHISPSRCGIELVLTGFIASGDNAGASPQRAEPGVIGNLLDGGDYGLVRLRGGSVSLGYGGDVYLFDDLRGVGDRIAELRRVVTARNAGIWLAFDGCGVRPDPDDLRRLSVRSSSGAWPSGE